tara:strand:- start:622 stop:774 length:153 start_codon:yes stop_codon:yes gene_type:complete
MSSEVDNILDIVSGVIYDLEKYMEASDCGFFVDPEVIGKIIKKLEEVGEQ